MNIWIVTYSHRHGHDAWPVISDGPPDLGKEADDLDDFEPDREEYLECFGPFKLEEIERR